MKKLFFAVLMAAISIPAIGQQQARCKATTQGKTQCKRDAVVNGHCKQHDPNKEHCAGTTKAGKPCKLSPQKDSKFCHLHKK